MIFSLGRLFKPPAVEAGPSVPSGCRVYAIGDIHGRADLLDKLVEQIARDLKARPVLTPLTICLGDYVDRGPDSAGVIDRLARADLPTPVVALRGNHDDLFEKLLRGAVELEGFLGMGGDATLASYGFQIKSLAGLAADELAEALASKVPPAHRDFLAAMAFSHSVGDYFFCHAGARPGVPLDRQTHEDLIWIREAFLRSNFDFGKVVVHGHTPVRMPEIRPNRIDVDTKAFASGVLTALVLEGAERRFLQT